MPGMPSTFSHWVGEPSRGSILGELAARDPARVEERVLLHAERTADVVAEGEPRVLRRDHDADAAGAHDLVDPDRRDVALAFVHPAAHRRVERQHQRLDEHAARVRLRDRLGGERSSRRAPACRPGGARGGSGGWSRRRAWSSASPVRGRRDAKRQRSRQRTAQAKKSRGEPRLSSRAGPGSERSDQITRMFAACRPFWPLLHFELDALVLHQRLESVALDVAEVGEEVGAARVLRDEAEALGSR